MNGFLYCVYSKTGEPNSHFEEFLTSLASLRLACPDSEVSLYTNIALFDASGVNVIYDENIAKSFICKAHALQRSPYEKTVFLDSDTVVHRDTINGIFSILEDFEICACYGNQFEPGAAIPDLNTGLVGVNNSPEASRLIDEWIRLYDGRKNEGDQRAFREVFLANMKSFHILPPYFNYRPNMIASYPKHAVVTHDRTQNKRIVTKQIAKKYWKTAQWLTDLCQGS